MVINLSVSESPGLVTGGRSATSRNVGMNGCSRIGLVLSAAILGCGGDMTTPGNQGPFPFTNVPAPPGGVAQFTVLPTTIAPGLTLTALGNLAPPGHVLPTDHVYFYDWDLSGKAGTPSDVRDVVMPATGAVFFI